MAGYSGTPLVKKLGIKPGDRVQFLNTPGGFELSQLTAGAKIVRPGTDAGVGDRATVDFALLFAKSASELKKALGPLLERVAGGGMVWVAWPKKASGVVTDLNENVVRATGLALGWVDVKVCAIDETWSGLKFYRRKAAAKAAARN
jgi:hypothetical protein